MSRVPAIIVAAGKGIRMNDPVRKQYHSLAGLPIIVHTLRVFDTSEMISQIFLVVPEDDLEFCRDKIIIQADPVKKITLVPGGPVRQDSVYNGLQAIEPNAGIVVIHDGVRPFVSHHKLEACMDGAKKWGACILGIPAYDTLKRVTSSGTVIETLERDSIWLAQTPQVFRYDLIKKAHEQARKKGYTGTDDASLVELLGVEVKILDGTRNNIKITNWEDLDRARIELESRKDYITTIG